MNTPSQTVSFERLTVGQDLGVSPWMTMDQATISAFGELTDDVEPLHMDPDWCAANSPFGRTIAYGFLTLSLLTKFLHEATGNAFRGTEDSGGFPINYGFDRIRLPEAVREGDRIRGRFRVSDVVDRGSDQTQFTINCEIEIDGRDKPAVVADWLYLWVKSP